MSRNKTPGFKEDQGNVMDFMELTDDNDATVDSDAGSDDGGEDASFGDWPEGHPLHGMGEEGSDDDDSGEGDEPEPDAADDSGDEPAEPQPKNDAERAKFWQSRHDKLAAEMQSKIDQLSGKLEVLQSGQQNQGQQQEPAEPSIDDVITQKATALSGLKPPSAPSKPSDYNAGDAYTDPDSASFKYQRAYEQWVGENTEYVRQASDLRAEIAELRATKAEETARIADHRQRMNAQERELVATLEKKYQFTPEQSVEFIQTMSDPKLFTLDNVVGLFKVLKGGQGPSKLPAPKGGGANPKPRVDGPPPAGSRSGGKKSGSGDDLNDSDAFSNSLLQG